MSDNTINQTLVSSFIPTQFPRIFREEGPIFVAFVQAYYKWMEQTNNTLYLSRRYYDIKDIDTTLDQFLLNFKEKYLSNVNYGTSADIRLLIKHALDLYRSKGTERALDLLFRVLYDEAAEIYYPKKDIFTLSSGNWFISKYLEVSISNYNKSLYHKQVVGLSSGATAFVDDVVRRISDTGHISDILYISSITGFFTASEVISPVDGSLPIEQSPMLLGSLIKLQFDPQGSGENFAIGDVVNILPDPGLGVGSQAKGIVSSILVYNNVLEANVIEGGYGFSNSSEIVVSDNILKIQTNAISIGYCRVYYEMFETISQPKCQIEYHGANGAINVGDTIYSYYGNGSLMGHGVVFAIAQTAPGNGGLQATLSTGSLNAAFIYTSGNTVVASINTLASNSYIDSTATGTYIGTTNTQITLSNVSGSFVAGETLFQYRDDVAPVNHSIYFDSCQITKFYANSILLVDTFNGLIRPGMMVYGKTSNASAYVNNVITTIAVTNVTGSFVTSNYNLVVSKYSNSASMVFASIPITNVAFDIVSNVTFGEWVNFNSDSLLSIANVALNAVSYGFPASPSANANNIISSALTMVNTQVGSIATLVPASGADLFQVYDSVPYIMAYEPQTYMNRFDLIIRYANATSSFSNGEIVRQSSTSARGRIMSVNSSALFVENYRIKGNNQFVITANSNSTIIGSLSGAVANITSIEKNYSEIHTGYNSNIMTSVITANGVLNDVTVTDSGFSYVPNSTVWISKSTTIDANSAYATAVCNSYGTGSGFYTDRNGFSSDSKKLFDGYYYQEYSYEVISSKTLDKYKDTLKQLIHISGTLMFGKLKYTQYNDSQFGNQKASITING